MHLPVVIEHVALLLLSYKLVVRSRDWIWLMREYKAYHRQYIVCLLLHNKLPPNLAA